MSGSRGVSDGGVSLGTEAEGPSTVRPTPTRQSRPGRLRSRTSTFSSTFTPPMPPLMSRENSAEDLHLPTPSHTFVLSPPTQTTMLFSENEAGPSKPRTIPFRQSPSRPSVNLANIRATSYSASLGPKSPMSPVTEGGATNKRLGLKRRISTPLINPSLEGPESTLGVRDEDPRSGSAAAGKQPEVHSRARATSTSHVNPSSSFANPAPTIPVPTSPLRPTTTLGISSRPLNIGLPQPGFSYTSPSPDQPPLNPTPLSPPPKSSILERAYTTTESSLRRLVSVIRPKSDRTQYEAYSRYRRGSDEDADSEKGMTGDEEESRPSLDVASEPTTASSSGDQLPVKRGRERGGYWGIWASEEKAMEGEEDGYFSLPPTPPERASHDGDSEFELALIQANGKIASLPTPALSAHSLSRRRGSPERYRMRGRVGEGWLRGVLSRWAVGGESGKTGAVLRELGWTLGVLVLGFVTSLGLALWLLTSLPITTLRHLPKSSTDLQLLSAEIRTYMNSSDAGWWHTVGVLTFVGCWKHAWSVPGAIVLNILVGSLLAPLPAVALLTIITATGSLGSYSLSRPLAPLIAVLFPKPLSLVRAALAPDSAPPPTLNPSHPTSAEHVTPIVPAPASSTEGGSVWRRLLIMRAMGIVPWSGMNVACGVVGVDWRTFWLTTAAGSASWSYTTASIGDLIARLAISNPAGAGAGGVDAGEMEGESLTGMLRDPVLLAKLAFLTGLTLIPVFLKRSSAKSAATPTSPTDSMNEKVSTESDAESILSPTSPSSVLAQSLARFTPTPAVFDILSFGRTAVRTGVGMAGSGVRHVGATLGRVAGVGR